MFKKAFTLLLLIGCFITLLSLGLWQVDRLKWKTNILDQIAAQEATDPMATPLDLTSDEEFQRGYLTGQYKRVKPIRLTPRTHEGAVGYHLLMPFITTDNQTVLVNMGWVANDNTAISFNTNQTKIAGYLKSPEAANRFTPRNNTDDNLWYNIEMEAIREQYGLDDVHPKILYLQSPENNAPLTFTDMPKPRNKHFQYAVFWFGMAGLLPILCGLFIWHSRRASAQARP